MPEHILVAIPSINGECNLHITNALLDIQWIGRDRYRFHRGFQVGRFPHDNARNSIVHKLRTDPALASVSRVLWIDADMGIDARILHLLDVDGDIVTAMYDSFGRDGIRTQFYPLLEEDGTYGTYVPDPRDSPLLVGLGCGFGACAVRRRVYDDPRMVLPRTYRDRWGREHPAPEGDPLPFHRFTFLPSGHPKLGEDMTFCLRARELGYSVVGVRDLEFEHYKVTGQSAAKRYAQFFAEQGYRDGFAAGMAAGKGA